MATPTLLNAPDTSKALEEFKNDPEKFLRKNFVTIGGGSTDRQAGLAIFKMELGGGTVEGGVPAWQIRISPEPNATAGADKFVAYYIPMKVMKSKNDNTGAIPAQVPTDGSVDLLVTSQLSGCTFAWNDKGQFAAHCRPYVPQDTPFEKVEKKSGKSRKKIAKMMEKSMGKDVRLVQKGVDYQEYATVVGKFKNSKWNLYVQNHGMADEPLVMRIVGITQL